MQPSGVPGHHRPSAAAATSRCKLHGKAGRCRAGQGAAGHSLTCEPSLYPAHASTMMSSLPSKARMAASCNCKRAAAAMSSWCSTFYDFSMASCLECQHPSSCSHRCRQHRGTVAEFNMLSAICCPLQPTCFSLSQSESASVDHLPAGGRGRQ